MSGFREELPQYKNINTYQDGVSSDLSEKNNIYIKQNRWRDLWKYRDNVNTSRPSDAHVSNTDHRSSIWVYVAYSATSQYANQCWIIIDYIIGNKSFRCNLNKEYHCLYLCMKVNLKILSAKSRPVYFGFNVVTNVLMMQRIDESLLLRQLGTKWWRFLHYGWQFPGASLWWQRCAHRRVEAKGALLLWRYPRTYSKLSETQRQISNENIPLTKYFRHHTALIVSALVWLGAVVLGK